MADHFADQVGLPLSKGSISNFNQEAYERPAPFESWAKKMQTFLIALHKEVERSGGILTDRKITNSRKKYRAILKKGEKECPVTP